MEIRTFDCISIDHSNRAYASAGEVLGCRTSQTTSSDKKNPCRSEFKLTYFARIFMSVLFFFFLVPR